MIREDPKPDYLPSPLSYGAFTRSKFYKPDGNNKVLDDLTKALTPKSTNENIEKELKEHMDKLKTMIGKTSM